MGGWEGCATCISKRSASVTSRLSGDSPRAHAAGRGGACRRHTGCTLLLQGPGGTGRPSSGCATPRSRRRAPPAPCPPPPPSSPARAANVHLSRAFTSPCADSTGMGAGAGPMRKSLRLGIGFVSRLVEGGPKHFLFDMITNQISVWTVGCAAVAHQKQRSEPAKITKGFLDHFLALCELCARIQLGPMA